MIELPAEMKVRKYRSDDLEDVRRICRETCTDEDLLAHDRYLCTKYADFYTETDPGHVWILADRNDRAQGYLLCCPDWQEYIRAWRREYLGRIRGCGFKYRFLQAYSMHEIKKMAKCGFPAHLHIDISPGFQQFGGGSQMMSALIRQLREENVSGIYLGCGISNAAGNRFYQRFGFSIYRKAIGRNIYTMLLTE